MIEESLKSKLLPKVEQYIQGIQQDWTVENVEDDMLLVHTHSTAAFLDPEKFHIILDENFQVFEVLLFAVRIIDGELVFVYHLFLRR